jgi:glycosyltransferase involved in cell wall biosynthesis
MKIIGLLNSYSEGISGGDLHFMEIFKRLKQAEKWVITSNLGKKKCQELGLKAKYLITSKEKKFTNICLTYVQRIINGTRLIKKINGADVVYSSSDFLPDTLPAYFYKLKNKKCRWIAAIHLLVPSLFYDYWERFLEKKRTSLPSVRRLLYFINQRLTICLAKKKADLIFVVNKLDREFLIKKFNINAKKIKVVNNGINYNELVSLPEEKKIYDAIFIARFHPQKGIFELLKIWQIVCQQKPNAKLCVIGSGSLEIIKKIKKEAKKLGVDKNIVFQGAKFGKEKLRLLKSSKIFVFPSLYESFAIVIAEAMACGLPVISYNLPVYKEIYNDYLLSVKIEKREKFAKIVINLLNNKEKRDKLSRSSQKFIKKCDWDELYEKQSNWLC